MGIFCHSWMRFRHGCGSPQRSEPALPPSDLDDLTRQVYLKLVQQSLPHHTQPSYLMGFDVALPVKHDLVVCLTAGLYWL